MRRVSLLFPVLCSFLLVFGTPDLAQTVVVTHNVNLRPTPSTTQLPKRLLMPPDELELLSTEKTNDYYHVRTEEGEEGWVWSRNARLAAATEAAGVLATAPAAAGISENWDKPAPNHSTFNSEDQSCGPFGDAPGNQTNLRKNRTDIPSSYHDVAYDAIHDLPFANLPKDRDQWTATQAADIARFEGVAVLTVGHLVAIIPQGGSGESTNCHWTESAQTDWHIALVKDAGDGENTSVVVETTPRLRKNHPKWTVSNVDDWVDAADPVRISGWLMFVPEHRNHLHTFRQTLWEIHPITRIEVMKDGQWQDLDTLH